MINNVLCNSHMISLHTWTRILVGTAVVSRRGFVTFVLILKLLVPCNTISQPSEHRKLTSFTCSWCCGHHNWWRVLNPPHHIAPPVAIASTPNTGTHTHQEEESHQNPKNRFRSYQRVRVCQNSERDVEIHTIFNLFWWCIKFGSLAIL